EMLVVIAVIVIVGAIASTVYVNAVREGAKGARTSDLRQLALAVQLYAGSTDGRTPSLRSARSGALPILWDRMDRWPRTGATDEDSPRVGSYAYRPAVLASEDGTTIELDATDALGQRSMPLFISIYSCDRVPPPFTGMTCQEEPERCGNIFGPFTAVSEDGSVYRGRTPSTVPNKDHFILFAYTRPFILLRRDKED
ncbi:MAG: hypothetical protein SFX74_01475, partial [Fimbriimonadaceae bacterium]|nr:hypothetical protein [Fimbriimonadaceae bacterium]